MTSLPWHCHENFNPAAKFYPRIISGKVLLRAIDGFARSIDCAAPSMDPLIAHLSIDRAIIYRSRTTALARSMDGICSRALV